MGSTCIPVYRIAEELEKEYDRVKFFDMEFDNPESQIIRGLPEVVEIMEIPFVIYFRNGKVVKTTSGTQTRFQVTTVLDQEFSLLINA
jgi:thioredoxin 1